MSVLWALAPLVVLLLIIVALALVLRRRRSGGTVRDPGQLSQAELQARGTAQYSQGQQNTPGF